MNRKKDRQIDILHKYSVKFKQTLEMREGGGWKRGVEIERERKGRDREKGQIYQREEQE